MHIQIHIQLDIEVNNYTTSKVSNISHKNVQQKDDGMDQNTLNCCYNEYVTTNQQT